MAKAITYALNQWDRVQRFTEVATLDLDNNSIERAIRPITLFRKNSLKPAVITGKAVYSVPNTFRR
jgi:hypothetical protein